MRSRNQPVSPKKPIKPSASSGVFQFMIAVSLLRSGCTPLGPTVAPANTMVVIKNSHLLAESDKLCFRTRVKIFVNFSNISSKVSAAVPPSLMNISRISCTISSYIWVAVMCPKVDGAPVNSNGMRK